MPNTASKLKSRSSKHTLLNSDHPFHCNDDRSSINSTYMDADDSSIDLSTISNYDQRFEATLADWGLAVEHDANSGRKPVGTPLYAAPEVVRKMKRVRRRKENFINYRACDIWSLGVTMFVM
ncbi:hypothetical protein B0O80DRAFT_58895 [Mortierella sp. GBAus27b]|nr:hypothetical protein B0O80DRAFT_58895 [Mortierella sp. GBAus27b]